MRIRDLLFRRVLAITTAVGLCLAALGHASADERADIEMLLLPYDEFPDRAAFKRVSSDPASVLLTIYDDPTTTKLLKLQALAAMAWFGDDARVEALFVRLLDSARTETVGSRMSHRAINAGTTALAERALPHLARLLLHDDVQIRLSVVYAAARMPEGREMLVRHLEKERNDMVVDAIRRQAPVLR